MRGLDENRVVGDSGLPIDVGPSLTDEPVPSAGLYWAPPGDYAVAIDSAQRHGGAYRLRFWINDVTPPALGRLRASPNGRTLTVPDHRRRLGRRPALPRVRARRAGRVDRSRLPSPSGAPARGTATIRVGHLPAGRYALAMRAGDYAESRDALAITISPQHVRTRVIGLASDGHGSVVVARAPCRRVVRARHQVDGG